MYNNDEVRENALNPVVDTHHTLADIFTIVTGVYQHTITTLRLLSAEYIGMPDDGTIDDRVHGYNIAVHVAGALIDGYWTNLKGIEIAGFRSPGLFKYYNAESELASAINFLSGHAIARWHDQLPYLEDVERACDEGKDISPEGCIWNTCLAALGIIDPSNPPFVVVWIEEVGKVVFPRRLGIADVLRAALEKGTE